MAIVLATFILAAQEILDLLYLALLFMSNQTELNSLVAKNACHAPQGISHSSLCQRALLLSLLFLKLVAFAQVGRYVTNTLLGFAKLNAILIAALKISKRPLGRRAWNRLRGEAHENLESRSLEFLSNYKNDGVLGRVSIER